MSDPRWTVDGDRFICYRGRYVIAVLADSEAKPEDVAEMRSALVECVRSHDTLTRARELAKIQRSLVPRFSERHTGSLTLLLDLLTGEGQS